MDTILNVGDKFRITGGEHMLNKVYRHNIGKIIRIVRITPTHFGDNKFYVEWVTERNSSELYFNNFVDDSIALEHFWKFAKDVGLQRYSSEPSWEV